MTFNSAEARDESGRWTAGGVAGLIFNLKALELNSQAFDELMARLKVMKISQEDMHKIATGYLGFQMAKSTPKPKLIQFMIDHQVRNARFHVRAPFQTGGGS